MNKKTYLKKWPAATHEQEEDVIRLSVDEWFDGMKAGAILALLLAGLACLVIFTFIDQWWADDTTNLKGMAVQRGAADWITDPSTGKTHFRWKEIKP